MRGFLCVDKEEGPSSFSVVAAARRALRMRRIGHAGTLDPAAGGLLILAVGTATRLLPYLPAEPKRYEFGVTFGMQTDTLDKEGTVERRDGRIPRLGELRDAIPAMRGTIPQQPPRFSACKINGERAYARSRRRETVSLAPRPVRIHSFRLTGYDERSGSATCDVTCSGGTYVRSLARDLARELGTCAFASWIRRTAIGPFSVTDAVPSRLVSDQSPADMISVEKAFESMPAVTLSPGETAPVMSGKDLVLQTGRLPSGAPGILAAKNEKGEVIAVLTRLPDARYHPRVVCGAP